jgi:hypothetical protein
VKLNRLHGVISQKMILFITTAEETSNPTKKLNEVYGTQARTASVV